METEATDVVTHVNTRVILDKDNKPIQMSHEDEGGMQMSQAAIAKACIELGIPGPPMPAPTPAPEEPALAEAYMTAVCQLGSGRFEGLSFQQKQRIACLVAVPVRPFREWAKLIAKVESNG